MSSRDSSGVEGLIDTGGLAARLGVSQATIRSWRSRGAAWLPEPVGKLDGLVWREQDLVGIEDSMPTGRGRPPLNGRRRSDQKIEVQERRARGAYYTPGDAAHMMAKWLVRREGETYLEPSLGDGVFVEAVADVTSAARMRRPEWVAAELNEAVAISAAQRGLVRPDEIRVGDFLSLHTPQVDAIIANPPYVRLRHLDTASRERALSVALEHLGGPMSPSGSIWMPFVLRMTASLKDGGRMAVVLPLDFTYVAYALPLWKHLGETFGSLRVVRSRERIFSEINQDVLILFADGRGETTESVKFEAFETVDSMVSGTDGIGAHVAISSIVEGDRAFQHALLPTDLNTLLDSTRKVGRTIRASTVAQFRIGYVAGDKKFFHPSEDEIRAYDLPRSSLRPSLINARKTRGHGLRTSEIPHRSVDHLWLPENELSVEEHRYARHGEKLGVPLGYKARIRSPWYKVPEVKAPDAIISVFSERPLLLINDASFIASNSFLCAYLRSGSIEQFAAAWYNPLTLLSIGLEVHSLGGGVMVMVPNEASAIEMLHPSLILENIDGVESALRSGDVLAAYHSGEFGLRNAFGSEGANLVMEGIQTLAHWRAR